MADVLKAGSGGSFPHLLSPISIGRVELRNRMCVTAHFAGWWGDGQGLPNDAFRAYVEARAQGGVGLFVIGATATTLDGTPAGHPSWFLNVDDSIIEPYSRIVRAAHKHGCAVFAQLIHCGEPLPTLARVAGLDPPIPRSSGAPSTRLPPATRWSIDKIADVVSSFGNAAARAVEAGVDGLELHAHERFLHAQFLSPFWNTRTDAYGGDLKGRSRLVTETLRQMRRSVAEAVPVGVRFKADDGVPGGMSACNYGELVHELEREGLVDFLSLTAGDQSRHHAPMYRPGGEGLAAVAELRKVSATRLPIIYAGGITDPRQAEQAVASGVADLVGLTKAHIADPQFAKKVETGSADDIRPCVRCLQNCIGDIERLTCIYNPRTGREHMWNDSDRAGRSRRVVIVGAGPAGMEAALTAERRGHKAVVIERERRVGGQIWQASASPLRRDFAGIADFYQRSVGSGLIDVRLGVVGTVNHILDEDPEVVVIATGSTPRLLPIPHGEFQPSPTLTVRAVVGEDLVDPTPRRAVVIDREGHMTAFVAADLLSSHGVEVYFVTPFSEPGPYLDQLNRGELCERLASRSVTFLPGWDARWWLQPSSLVVAEVATGDLDTIKDVEMAVAANGSDPLNELGYQVMAAAPNLEVRVIGDASGTGTVQAATYHGARVGHSL